MPIKIPKKREKLEELIKVFEAERDSIKPGCCMVCESAIALYQCSIDTMLWTMGEKPKKFSQMAAMLKRKHRLKSKHHVAHAE
jgi:hypothetical protein